MELEKIVANNMSELRKGQKWTQAELAEKLNYSDKSVSKWERGDALPDLKVMARMAELFGVTVDYFLNENAAGSVRDYSAPKRVKGNRIVIALLAVTLVFLVATIAYVYSMIYMNRNNWVFFIWAVPASCICLGYMDWKWLNRKFAVFVQSLLCWTLLAAIYLQFISYNIWMIFIVGVPMQVTVILLDQIRRSQSKR